MKPAPAETGHDPIAEPSVDTGSVKAFTEDVDPKPSTRNSVTIKLAGKEYRLRSEASEEELQRVAVYVDQAMQRIRERTDTVDSQDTALLTALNLAREVLHLREKGEVVQELSEADADNRIRGMIEKIEAVLPKTDSEPS
jgi:cell division protein ZapA (FtsZ GTPase activity inhibitor)